MSAQQEAEIRIEATYPQVSVKETDSQSSIT